MTRLTNDMRSIICKAALEATLAERRSDLAAQEASLAREAYDATFSADLQRLIAKVPGNWFRNDPCLNFNVGGLRIRLRTGGNGLPVPYQSGSTRGYGCHNEIGVIQPGDLCDRIQAHAKAKEAFREKTEVASRDLGALLGSISSVGQLQKVWPEGQPFYARFLDSKAPSLPAIRFAEVNATLGLAAA